MGTLAAFRVGHADGRALAGEFGGTFTPAQFADLLVTVSSSAGWQTPGPACRSKASPSRRSIPGTIAPTAQGTVAEVLREQPR